MMKISIENTEMKDVHLKTLAVSAYWSSISEAGWEVLVLPGSIFCNGKQDVDVDTGITTTGAIN